MMEKEHFGTVLRRAREGRQISLAEVAEVTKVPRFSLQRIEAGTLEDLPAEVFVRGFIRSYSRAVGLDEREPLALFDRARAVRAQAALAPANSVQGAPSGGTFPDEENPAARRGRGFAVFVIILLLIATITLSLLLRKPPPSGEGLSLVEPGGPASKVAASLPRGGDGDRGTPRDRSRA